MTERYMYGAIKALAESARPAPPPLAYPVCPARPEARREPRRVYPEFRKELRRKPRWVYPEPRREAATKSEWAALRSGRYTRITARESRNTVLLIATPKQLKIAATLSKQDTAAISNRYKNTTPPNAIKHTCRPDHHRSRANCHFPLAPHHGSRATFRASRNTAFLIGTPKRLKFAVTPTKQSSATISNRYNLSPLPNARMHPFTHPASSRARPILTNRAPVIPSSMFIWAHLPLALLRFPSRPDKLSPYGA